MSETNILNENRINWKSIGPVVGHWNENGLRRVIDNLVIGITEAHGGNVEVVTMSLKKSEKGIDALKFSTPNTPIIGRSWNHFYSLSSIGCYSATV